MKHKKTHRKMSNKQAATIIISVLCAAALLIGLLVVIGPILGGNNGGHYEGDGHDHSANGGHYEGDGHDHGAPTSASNAKVKYQLYTNADKTYRVVFRDAKGTILMEEDKIPNQPIREKVDADKGVYTVGWATGKGPNDYAHIYYNELTGQVSETIVAPRGTDGVRVAYGSADQQKIIVQDLFDKTAYYKEYELTGADTTADDIILGGKLVTDGLIVSVSYLVADGKTRHANVKLYE